MGVGRTSVPSISEVNNLIRKVQPKTILFQLDAERYQKIDQRVSVNDLVSGNKQDLFAGFSQILEDAQDFLHYLSLSPSPGMIHISTILAEISDGSVI